MRSGDSRHALSDETEREKRGGRRGSAGLQLLLRFIRLRDAPGYLGMDRNKFNALVRPTLTEIPLGAQSIAFDRLELDAWASHYKDRNGRPGRSSNGGRIRDANDRRASSSGARSGTSTSASADGAFSKALAQISSSRRKSS